MLTKLTFLGFPNHFISGIDTLERSVNDVFKTLKNMQSTLDEFDVELGELKKNLTDVCEPTGTNYCPDLNISSVHVIADYSEV